MGQRDPAVDLHDLLPHLPARTLRTDNWLKSPIVVDLGFAAFIIYATVRAFQRDHFFVEKYHYLTPFYSPC
ncbi:MAG: hypothetical protein E6Q57_11595, partial [Mycobacterium sp.]